MRQWIAGIALVAMPTALVLAAPQSSSFGTLQGGDNSFAIGINNQGQIVGASEVIPGEFHPFLWEDGEMLDLGLPAGAVSGSATAINERGQIVGWTIDAMETVRAFLWEDGVMRDPGTLGGNFTIAHDINSRGQIVGWSNDVSRWMSTFGSSPSCTTISGPDRVRY